VSEELKDPIRMVSFLPLSHVTAQMADFSRLLVSRRPVQVNFGEPEIVMTRIHELLKIVKPTELIAVPRVYEKWQSFIKMKMKKNSATYQ
jgi:long-subunit acyl-CoA synthetase (AMP-forming)